MTMPPDPSKDPRKHRRFTVDVDARVHLVDGQQIKARTRDLSRTGICLITAQSVPTPQSLSLELVLAFSNDAFSEPLRLPARVVWCTPIGHSFQVGAMFEEISDEQDGFLEMFLQFLDGTLAPKGVPEAPDDEPLPPSPEDTDDPFRN